MRRRLGAGVVAVLFGLALPATAALAADGDAEAPTADAVIATAVHWLSTQQQPDGGFDGVLPGGATPDAILALAESTQSDVAWAVRPALERVELEISEDNRTPLDAARRIARRIDDPLVTARLISRVALPLGLEVDDHGPLGNLVREAGHWLARDDLAFVARVELADALLASGGAIPEDTVETVLAAQQANGGWNADGDPEGEVQDLATTGAVVDLLVLAGADRQVGAVPAALSFVAETRTRSGVWADPEGERSAVATAGAIRAIRAVGHDPSANCWQVRHGGDADEPTPIDALSDLQESDGSFADRDPAYATSEAVHALSGRRLPLGRLAAACGPEDGGLPVDPALVVLGAIAVVGVGGGVRIMRGASPSF